MKDMILEYIKNEYIDEDEADEIVLDENTPLISSGIVDSFSMVSLKRFLEKKYAISIPDEEASPEAFNTVTSIIALVNRHTAKNRRAHERRGLTLAADVRYRPFRSVLDLIRCLTVPT